MTTADVRPDPLEPRIRPAEARQAASRVIGAWAADRCPTATSEELEELAREVVRAVRRAVTPRVVAPAHEGLTSKPGADAEAARRIAARLEAELRAPAPTKPLNRPVQQPPRRLH